MGERIGPYEIVSAIGEGGMGQVYRAVDTRLDRIIAIKRIKGGFTDRFEREARAISALNHPHIATLHDVGTDYLVMEYVEGKPLAGPLPVEKALEYGKQILSALEAAHRLGIVHRDLKPANILVTKAGVKLLDFGLAKMRSKTPAATEHTVTIAITGEHTIVGTPQYMSPEQIEGRETDARSDIFAFGCVMYELLTGQRAFDGKSASSVMAAVLATDPRPLRELAPVVPERLDKVLRACLAKDPDERWQHATDLRRELEWLSLPEPTTRRKTRSVVWAAGTALLVLLLVSVLLWWQRRGVPDQDDLVAFTLTGPVTTVEARYGVMAVSPDGQRIAIVASGAENSRGIWVRELRNANPRLLTTHSGVYGLFWSPDSRTLGFAAGSELKAIDIATSEITTLATKITPNFRGGSWNATGEILYAPSPQGPLYAVRRGDKPQLVFDPQKAETGGTFLTWPWFLPDGKHFLAVGVAPERGESTESAAVYLGTLGDSRIKKLMDGGNAPRYARGHVFFVGKTLSARPFDADRLEFTGPAVHVVDNVAVFGQYSMFGVGDRTLAYFERTAANDTRRAGLAWITTAGKPEATIPRATAHAEVSPDGNLIAYSRERDLWVREIGTGAEWRLTFDPGNDWIPAWTPDSKTIVWAGSRAQGQWQLLRKSANGAGTEEQLTNDAEYKHHLHVVPDGKSVIYECGSSPGGDLCVFAFADRSVRRLFTTKPTEIEPQLSPDGKWLAYATDSSGRFEVYVHAYPSLAGPWQVSTQGGVQPRWRKDGRVMYYLDHKADVVSVSVSSAGDAFRVGTAEKVVSTSLEPLQSISHFAVAPDGKHLLVTVEPSVSGLQISRNWQRLLRD